LIEVNEQSEGGWTIDRYRSVTDTVRHGLARQAALFAGFQQTSKIEKH
jgi:hypothetical protein